MRVEDVWTSLRSSIISLFFLPQRWSGGAMVLGKLPVPGRPTRGWSGGAMVLGKLPVPGRPTILITVGQGPIALAVGAGGGGLDIFTLIYPSSSPSPSLWETARYRLKYCLKGPLNPKQPTNQKRPTIWISVGQGLLRLQ